MHSACKAQTASRTLDLVSERTSQLAGGGCNSTSAAAIHGSNDTTTSLAASASPGVSLPGVSHGLLDAMDAMGARALDMEGEQAASGTEVCRQGQPPGGGCAESAFSSAANAAGREYSMEQQTGDRISSSGSEAGMGSSIGSQYRQASTDTFASHGGKSCSDSTTDGRHEGEGMTEAGSGDAADNGEGVSSSSIHSRLLRAARAAKASAAVSPAQAESSEFAGHVSQKPSLSSYKSILHLQ